MVRGRAAAFTSIFVAGFGAAGGTVLFGYQLAASSGYLYGWVTALSAAALAGAGVGAGLASGFRSARHVARWLAGAVGLQGLTVLASAFWTAGELPVVWVFAATALCSIGAGAAFSLGFALFREWEMPKAAAAAYALDATGGAAGFLFASVFAGLLGIRSSLVTIAAIGACTVAAALRKQPGT